MKFLAVAALISLFYLATIAAITCSFWLQFL